MSSIPEDLYLQILIRVPVKSALVCKCVCKKWLDLISSSEFVQLHLHFNIQKNNYNLVLNNAVNEFSRSCLLQSISYDSLSVTGRIVCQDGVIKMDYPFKSSDYQVELRCAYHGLVFLCFSDYCTEILCLWNPATTEFKILPKLPGLNFDIADLYMSAFFDIYTLGYDDKMEDYKLVKVLIAGTNTFVYIYTLGSNSWKCIGTIPYKFPYHEGPSPSGEIFNGALHWLVKTVTSYMSVVSFNIADEKFEELPLPEKLQEKKESLACLGKWDECLSLLVNSNNFQFDVWVMQEYGVHESWTKRSSITLTFVADDSFYSRTLINVWGSHNNSHRLRIMWSFKNGKILFEFCGDVFLYDLKSETYKRIRTLVSNAENYIESLVSLNSSAFVSGLKTRGVNLKHKGKGKDIVCGFH
ncbi:F-box protein CPR1-like [Papaver somniferum]|uniref:F-box protein CPR1-like n=1 Tax=Papaver somniferum TaxID=3469 RepID=UPI000E701945|nr:F-box protein CPR1-like [Papaver somniferum]